MVTVVYRMTTKPGREQEFIELVKQFRESALQTTGCITYTFYQSLTDTNSFIVYYRFASKEDQDQHVSNLIRKFGRAAAGSNLPLKFTELLAEDEVILFD